MRNNLIVAVSKPIFRGGRICTNSVRIGGFRILPNSATVLKPLLIAILLLLQVSISYSDDAPPNLSKIDRKIGHEPHYQNTPHYALLVFGPKAEHRSWLVIDGDSVAYLDRNGNGDLTEPGERIELDVKATNEIKLGGSPAYRAMNVFRLGKVAGSELTFQLWVRNPDFDAAHDEFYRDRFREWDEKKWMNGSLYRVAAGGAGAQNPVLLTATADEAQISHLDGPLTFDLKWGDQQRLEPWPKETIFDVHIGSRNLPAKNCAHEGFGFSPLTTTEVPPEVRPIAKFEFSSASPKGKPIIRELPLDQRCCGDTFYARFTLPEEVTAEHVNLTVSCPGWPGRQVHAAEFRVSVNRELSRFGERVYVIFHDPKITIKDAVNVLRRRGLDVQIQSDQIAILENGQQSFGVSLLRSKEVRETSARLGRGTKYADKIGDCDARFEIGFRDTKQIQGESNTLIEIRSALQEFTHGFIYNTWDKALAGPG
jgi:hypothetical protein